MNFYKLFVGKNIPFVCCSMQVNLPFICRNIPNGTFSPKKMNNGFTLVELIVTMAVAAILVTVAVPNMRTFVQNGRLNTQVNDLIGDLNLARSEAIRRRVNVGLTKSATANCAPSVNWRDGRVIFADLNNSGVCDAGEVLRFREPLASATDTLVTTVVGDPIFFSPNGTSPYFPPGSPAAGFTFCDDRGPAKGKQINFNAMGQAAISSTPPVAC